MAASILRVSLMLAVLRVAGGQSTASGDSHCSYTIKVQPAECSQISVDETFMKQFMIAQQDQLRLLAMNQEKLTDETTKLRHELETLKADVAARRNRTLANVKQCSTRGLNFQGEYGLIFSCDFVKKRNETVLRIVWNGDLRLLHVGPKGATARRWFFTINGKECREPKTIDTQLYQRDPRNNIHRPAYVEGYCRGIPAGDVFVAWNVGDVVNGVGWDQSDHNVGDSWTGWVATVRIIVEEVDVENAESVIV